MELAILLAVYAASLPTVPGVDNPAVTQATLATTICDKHRYGGFSWVHNQRPPTSITNAEKFAAMDRIGIPRSQAKLYEWDHAASIEDGGSPTDLLNLWLQPYAGIYGARVKDRVETKIAHGICSRPTGSPPIANMLGRYRVSLPTYYRAGNNRAFHLYPPGQTPLGAFDRKP
jgi:hypothetical protein